MNALMFRRSGQHALKRICSSMKAEGTIKRTRSILAGLIKPIPQKFESSKAQSSKPRRVKTSKAQKHKRPKGQKVKMSKAQKLNRSNAQMLKHSKA